MFSAFWKKNNGSIIVHNRKCAASEFAHCNVTCPLTIFEIQNTDNIYAYMTMYGREKYIHKIYIANMHKDVAKWFNSIDIQ